MAELPKRKAGPQFADEFVDIADDSFNQKAVSGELTVREAISRVAKNINQKNITRMEKYHPNLSSLFPILDEFAKPSVTKPLLQKRKKTEPKIDFNILDSGDIRISKTSTSGPSSKQMGMANKSDINKLFSDGKITEKQKDKALEAIKNRPKPRMKQIAPDSDIKIKPRMKPPVKFIISFLLFVFISLVIWFLF